MAVKTKSKKTASKKPKAGKKPAKEKGRSRFHYTDAEMQCRHPGCEKRSSGPRFAFKCRNHRDPKVGWRKGVKAKPASTKKPAKAKGRRSAAPSARAA